MKLVEFWAFVFFFFIMGSFLEEMLWLCQCAWYLITYLQDGRSAQAIWAIWSPERCLYTTGLLHKVIIFGFRLSCHLWSMLLDFLEFQFCVSWKINHLFLLKIAICFVVSLFAQCACSMLISCPDFNMWCWYCSIHFYKLHLRQQLFLVILYEIECFDWSSQNSWKVIQDFNQTFKTVEDVSMIEDKWLMIGRELILKLYMLKIFTSWRIVSHFVVFCLGIEWCLCQFFWTLREGFLF